MWLHNANGEVTEYKGERQSYGILMGVEITQDWGGGGGVTYYKW